MKVIELLFNDSVEEAGVDAIALVENPAHMENWMAFSTEETQDEYMYRKALEWAEYGEKHEDLIEDGYELVSIKRIDNIKDAYKFNVGNISSDPNETSVEDYASTRIRYKYVGPQDNKNRDFCRAMMEAANVYRIEDIQRMTADSANSQFGFYDIFTYRGSYNCRHYWVELQYKDTGRILNNSNRQRGVVGEQEVINANTETRTTANARERKDNERGITRMSLVSVLDGNPLFSTPEEAEKMAELFGCKGYHTHTTDKGIQLYMPCEKHPEQSFSFNDYPEAAKENACKVLRWIDEHGRDEVGGMTQTGLARANQLCSGENISEETIARMAAFERHRENSNINPEFEGTPWKDNGYVAWLGWGGDEGIAWAKRKLETIREEMLYDNPCQAGYVAYGTKIKDGRTVPNCIPQEMSKSSFSYDGEKMEITGPAVIPNKLIIRQGRFGEPYYVYFSTETIRQLQQKFMEKKLVDSTNIEHIEALKADSFVIESWIIEDTKRDKSYVLGLEYPVGTWMITMKVKNASVWENIKKGKLNGFSVEGFFDEARQFDGVNEDDIKLDQIKQILFQTK
jgi:hypothetical protein